MKKGLVASLIAAACMAGLTAAEPPERPGTLPDLSREQPPTAQRDQPPSEQLPVAPAPGTPPAAAPAADAAAPATTTNTNAPQVDLRDCHTGPPERVWGGVEYLLWWTRPEALRVPLVTAGPTTSTPIIGQPGTTIIVGDSSLEYPDRSGARATAGMWLDDRHVFGWEASGFVLEDASANQAATVGTGFNLSRPFINTALGPPNSGGAPDASAVNGGVFVDTSTALWGVETNLVRNLFHDQAFDANLLFGFRYLDLHETLHIRDEEPGGIGMFTTSTTLTDSFSTRNQFYAGQFGGRISATRGIWSVSTTIKVALGPNHENIGVAGVTEHGGALTTGGLLALSGANIGSTQTNWFTIAPEVGVQLGCQLSERLRAQIGYNFLYVSDVVRPGSQINPHINPDFIPYIGHVGPSGLAAEPVRDVIQDQFWMHGVSAGITLSF